MIDLGRADKIARLNDARLYKSPPPIPQVYSKRRIKALSAYVQGSNLPCEFTRKPFRHRDYPWIGCIPHAVTPECVVYADVYSTREEHRKRVEAVPEDKWWRCQGFMAVTGAPRCDYITIYPLSDEEAKKERGQASWGAHDRAWKWRKTYFHIHQVERDEEAIAHLLKQCFDIRKRAGYAETKRRPSANQVRAEFVPGRRETSKTRKAYGTRRAGERLTAVPRRPRKRLVDARGVDSGEGQD